MDKKVFHINRYLKYNNLKKNNSVKAISIIVPIYNLEQYLPICLASIQRQTFDNYEVILVDDGSTDNSKIVAQKYVSTYPEKFKYIYQKNSGVSAARNVGLKKAKGQYLLFLDGDDFFLDINMLMHCYNIVRKLDLDILCFNAALYFDETNQKPFYRKYNLDKDAVLSGEEFFNLSVKTNSLRGEVCFNMYKRIYLQLNDFCFDESLYMGEDQLFSMQAFLSAKRVQYINKVYYGYRVRIGSAMNSGLSDKKMFNWLKTINKIFLIYQETQISNRQYIAQRLMRLYLSTLQMLALEPISRTKYIKYLNCEVLKKIESLQTSWYEELIYWLLKIDRISGYFFITCIANLYVKLKFYKLQRSMH